jgi:RHS repeat-associated protein
MVYRHVDPRLHQNIITPRLSWGGIDYKVYLPNGRRFRGSASSLERMRKPQAGQNSETIYVNRWFSVRNSSIVSKHVFADDVRLATIVSSSPNPSAEKVYFFQPDHLGSTHFVTDNLGKAWQHLEYFPGGEVWADERSQTEGTPFLFSGNELDEETGLYDYGFRYYDGRQGQWLSADPVLDGLLETTQLARPQPTHRPFRLSGHVYGYAGNSPTNRTDAQGLEEADPETAKSPEQILSRRAKVLRAAFEQHPERFKGRQPQPKSPPQKVWINPPRSQFPRRSFPKIPHLVSQRA